MFGSCHLYTCSANDKARFRGSFSLLKFSWDRDKGLCFVVKNGRHFAVLRSHLLRHIWTAISDNSKWHTKFRGEWILLFSRVLYCLKYLMTIHRFAVSFCTIRLRTIEFKLKWNKLSNIQDISLVDLCIPGFSAEHFKSNLSFVLMDGFSKQ